MAQNAVTTHELYNQRVVGGKGGTKTVGKIRNFVFHPKERRVIGFIVKRPDVAWMFHRKDLFLSIDGYDFVDGRIAIRDESTSTDKAALKQLGVSWDDCVLWVGLPIMCEDGTRFGTVGSVTFHPRTGKVIALEADAGMTANALLGKRTVSASSIRGFKRGMGVELAGSGTDPDAEEAELGALIVSDEVKNEEVEGGLADKAGRATAVAKVRVKDAAGKAKAKTEEKVKPAVSEATKAAGKAVNKGAYAVGRQVGRSKGMFSAFKEEYNKARYDGEPPKKK